MKLSTKRDRFFKKRKLIVLATVATTVSLFFGISLTPANAGVGFPKKPVGSKLNLFNWSNYIDPELLKRFTAETGITVNLGVYESNSQMLAKLESGARGYDVIVPTDYMVQIMISKGLLQHSYRSLYPNGGNIKSAFAKPYFDRGRMYTVPYLHGTTGFAYLKDKVSPAPTSWKEFFAAVPKYPGKTTIFDDDKEAINAALRAGRAKPCTKNPVQLQAALDLLKSIKPSLNTIASSGNIGRLSSGTSVLLQMYNGATYKAGLANANVVYVYPSDGLSLWQDNFAIPVGAENIENAKIFLNWMMDPKNSAQAAKWAGYNTAITGSDVLLPKAMFDDPAFNPSAAQMARAVAMAPCSTAVNDLYSKVWTAFKQ
jgi:spermidine/putrescine transport system substrate-binding protein